MRILVLFLSLGLTCLAVAAVPTPGSGFLPRTFQGARLGMTIEQWRSLRRPAALEPDAQPVCSGEMRTEKIQGRRLSATEANSTLVSCTYATRAGERVLPNSMALETGDTMNSVAWLFAGGRLSEIRFEVPVAAFDDLTSRFNADYGRPAVDVSDAPGGATGPVRRVRETWRTPRGTVVLINPSADRTQMVVGYFDRAAVLSDAAFAWNPADPRLDH